MTTLRRRTAAQLHESLKEANLKVINAKLERGRVEVEIRARRENLNEKIR